MEIQQDEESSFNSRRKNLMDRLLSIHHDVDSFLIPKVIVPFQIGKHHSTQSSSSNKREEDDFPPSAKWPLLSNERCGMVRNKFRKKHKYRWMILSFLGNIYLAQVKNNNSFLLSFDFSMGTILLF